MKDAHKSHADAVLIIESERMKYFEIKRGIGDTVPGARWSEV